MTYTEFINNIIQTRGQWSVPNNCYFEKHHILPMCLGGEGDFKNGHFKRNSNHQNCIWLTAQEHFIAHKLLAKENPTNYQLVLAWSMMAFPKGNTKRDFEITPDEYAEIRKLQAEVSKGRISSEETRKKISRSKMGRKQSEEEKLQKSRTMLAKNLVWFTNGKEEIRCTKENCPKGFIPGRNEKAKSIAAKNLGRPQFGSANGMFGKHLSAERKKQNSEWSSARRWFNNGQIERFEIECPEGFHAGRLKPKKIIWPEWQLPDGSRKRMKPCLVKKYHPDWKLIEDN